MFFIRPKADAYSECTFFLSPKLSYVLFILARDHLGNLVFAGDGKISLEICSTPFPTYFFSKYVRYISLTYYYFFIGVLNSATRGSDRSPLLFDAKTIVLKMNSPPSPPATSSPQFVAASAVPPARMSLSGCLSSDGTNNIEK